MESFSQIKKQLLKNPATRKAYDDLGPEFAMVEAIIARRIAKGLTQKDLAKKMGTQQSAIARLESGSYNPSLAFLERVAKALDARLEISLS